METVFSGCGTRPGVRILRFSLGSIVLYQTWSKRDRISRVPPGYDESISEVRKVDLIKQLRLEYHTNCSRVIKELPAHFKRDIYYE
jgi:hypothetical protein